MSTIVRSLAVATALAALAAPRAAMAAGTDAPPASAKEDGLEDKPTSLSIAAAPVLPIGDLSSAVGLGLGATLGIDRALSRNVAIVGRAGYIHHLQKEGIQATLGAMPLWAGARYRFTGAEGAYLEGLLGPTVLFASVDTGRFGRVSDSEIKIGTALGAGYKIDRFDIGGRMVFYDLGHADDSMGLMATAAWSFAAF